MHCLFENLHKINVKVIKQKRKMCFNVNIEYDFYTFLN